MAYKTAYNDLIIAENRVSVSFETYIIINKMYVNNNLPGYLFITPYNQQMA